jgi:hypothetical protein
MSPWKGISLLAVAFSRCLGQPRRRRPVAPRLTGRGVLSLLSSGIERIIARDLRPTRIRSLDRALRAATARRGWAGHRSPRRIVNREKPARLGILSTRSKNRRAQSDLCRARIPRASRAFGRVSVSDDEISSKAQRFLAGPSFAFLCPCVQSGTAHEAPVP